MKDHASINRIYRLVWNEALGQWVAVAEHTRGRSKRASALLLAALALPAIGATPDPTQLPTGGRVTGGAATITPGPATLTVEQRTQRATVNWNTFNLGRDASVNFKQPDASSATLNRVLDSNPSQVMGRITANGQVYLSNPNGVVFGKSASVDVGSLTATTHSISDADFMAGKATLARDGAAGSVINEGELRARLGGYIALLAPEVRNAGIIIARMGTVALAAGETITLNFDGSNTLASLTVKPSAIQALVDNRGAVLAPGGTIILSAQALDRLQGGVVRNSGRLEATGFAMKGGKIVLESSTAITNSGTVSADAGADGSPAGRMTLKAPEFSNSGSITAAAAPLSPLPGGRIELQATTIEQVTPGLIDASGAEGGQVKLLAAQAVKLQGRISAAALDEGSVADGSGGSGGSGGSVEIISTAGDVTLDSAQVDVRGPARGGQIRIEAAAAPAPAAPSPGLPALPLNEPGPAPTLALLGSSLLSTSSRRGRGGGVTLAGARVGLLDTSRIDARGASGGGSVFVGGGLRGADASIANAQQTVIARAARIDASAAQSGDGGTVVIWSDGRTAFGGSIAARGGSANGNGGLVEVSGMAQLEFLGTVDAAASHGASGSLLLDPHDLTIDTFSATEALTDVDSFSDKPAADTVISPGTITAVANTGTGVVLLANNDIVINALINTVAPGTGGALRFHAGRSITLNAGITSDNGDIHFIANHSGAAAANRDAGTATFTNNSLIDSGTGSVSITMGSGVAGAASGSIYTGHVAANDLTVAHNGATPGAVAGQITLGVTTIANDLAITATGDRHVLQDITSTVVVRNSASIRVGSGEVTLANTANDFGTIGVTGGKLTLNDTNAMQFGASALSGDLSATTHGPLASGAVITVSGSTALTAISGGFGVSSSSISLTGANHFSGSFSAAAADYLNVNDTGSINTGTVSAGTDATFTAGGAITLGGTTSVASDLTLTAAGGAITGHSRITVPHQTTLRAGGEPGSGGPYYDITLDAASNDFNGIQILAAQNATLVDTNGINFGYWSGAGGPTKVYGNLSVTAGGDITQDDNHDSGNSITVVGTSLFTANHASAQINLRLGDDPFNAAWRGNPNSFGGSVTLARSNASTGFSDVELRNISANAAQLIGLTSVGTLHNLYLSYNNAPGVTLPGMTLTGSLKLYAPTVAGTAGTPANKITQTGPIVAAEDTMIEAGGTGDVVLTDAGNDFNRMDIVAARHASIRDASAIQLHANGQSFAINGNLDVTARGAITEGTTADWAYYMTVPNGTASFSAASADGQTRYPVTLNNQYNRWSTVRIVAADTVTIHTNTNLAFDDSTIDHAMTVSSGSISHGLYTLSQLSGTRIQAGTGDTTTFSGLGTINLPESGNVLGHLAINAGSNGSSSVNASITIRENDAITQASAWSIPLKGDGVTTNGTISLSTSNEQALQLGSYGNSLGKLTLTQFNNGATSAGAVSLKETDADGINQNATGWTTHGTVTLNSGANSIRLTHPDNILGPLQVTGATGSSGNYDASDPTVTIYAKAVGSADAISDAGGTGPWSTARGVVKLIAYDSTGSTPGGGSITLANTGNALGDVYVKAVNVVLTENDSITDGNSGAVWNSFGDKGWSTSGNAQLTVVNPGGRSITLANINNLIGPMGITTAGTPGTLDTVLVTDNSHLTQFAVWTVGAAPVTVDARNHDIVLSNSGNVLGALTVNTSNGLPTSVAITENDAITQAAPWVLNGKPVTLVAENGKSITLTEATNAMGNLTVTGGAVSITENDAITQPALGAWTSTGTTTLDATANAITLAHTANVLGPLAITGAPSAVTITENDNITQAAAWVLTDATPVKLNAQSSAILLTRSANVLGDLSLTAQNTSVTEADAITDGSAWIVPGNTTLTAGANAIVLNANPRSNLGTLKIVSATDADVADLDGLVFDTSSVSGTLNVTVGGALTQIGAISADAMRIIGAGHATLTHTANSVGTLAAGFSGGALTFTNSGDMAIGIVGGTSGVSIGAQAVTLSSVNGTLTGLANINATSTALTLSTGTALSLPQMSIAGPQRYTGSTVSGPGIILGGNITGSAAGAISFMSPVTLAADVSVQSSDSAIGFAGTLAGSGHQASINAGTGTVEVHGAVNGLGDSGDATAALQLTASASTFHATLGASNGITVGGPVVFKDEVTLADGNVGSLFTGQVTLGKAGGMGLSGFDGMNFNNGVLLQNGAATIKSNDSALSFQSAGSISGPFGLTLDAGTGTLTGLGRVGTNLTSLAVTAAGPSVPAGLSIAGPQDYTATGGSSVLLNGALSSTAAGALTFHSPVTLGAAATLSTVNSNIVFQSTLDGNKDLTLAPGSGLGSFGGEVGGITALGDGSGAALILQGSGASSFTGPLTTRSGLIAAGALSFGGNVTLGNGDTGSSFGSRVTTVGAAGNTIGSFDGIAFTGGLTLTNGPVSITSNGSLLSFGAAVSGAQDLTLHALAAGAGAVSGLAFIGAGSTLTRLDVTTQALSLPAAGLDVAGPMRFSAAGGITLNGAVGDGSRTGQIDFIGPVTLATGAIAVNAHNAAVSFGSSIDGAQTLSVNGGSGAISFAGTIGGATPLGSLTTAGSGGSTALNGGGVTTSGAQTYGNAVILGASTALTGVNVRFNGSIDGARSLSVVDSGNTAFLGTIGASTLLASITTDAPGTLSIASPGITTSGAQSYGENLTLTADTSLSGTGITLGGTVNGAYALSADAGTGALRLLGAVGGSTPLASLSAGGLTVLAGSVSSSGMQAWSAIGGITLAGALATNNATVMLTGPLMLGGDLSIHTGTGPGDIVFSDSTSTINGAHGLALAAGIGDVRLGGVVGGSVPLAATSISARNLTLPVIHTVGAANQRYNALNDLTLTQSRTLGAATTFTADADGDGSGSFILPDGVSVTAANQALSISAADLDLQGSSTLGSGSGLLSITASHARNIALGGSPAAGQMTISGNELARISSAGGLELKTTGAGWIRVTGISAAQSQNITGTLGLQAQGTGDIGFITAPSAFNALRARSSSGTTHVAVNLSSSNDPISFASAVTIAGASTLSSAGGAIAFLAGVALDNDLTLSTGGGLLSFAAPVGSNKALTLNLGGGTVSGLDQLQNTLTGLTVNSTSAISLPAFTINGPQVYGTGVITITGDLGGQGLAFNNVVNLAPATGSALTLDAGAGTLAFKDMAGFNAVNLRLLGNEIDFAKAVTGSGALSLAPSSTGRAMIVGSTGAAALGSLNMSAADLAWLPLGTLASLTIGQDGGIGTLDVAGPFNTTGTALTLNAGGGISQSGGSLKSGALTLNAGSSAVTLANVANAFGAVAIGGAPASVSLRNNLAITQQGNAGWALDTAALTLDAGTHDILLTNGGNSFGTVTLSGREASLSEAAATDLGATALSGGLTIRSSGLISQSGALNVGGNLDVATTLNAGDVRINNSGAASTTLGDARIGGDYTLTATGQTVSQAPGTSVQIAGNFEASATQVLLSGAGNLIGGTTSSNASATVVAQSGVITLGSRNEAGHLTVISRKTDRSISGGAVHGDAILLTNAANHIGGSIAVSASPPTVGSSSSDVQTGILQAAGTALNVAGTASFTAEASSAGSLGVQLNNAGNRFGLLALSGNAVSVRNGASGTTTLAGAGATTHLTLDLAGALAQTSPVTTPTLSVSAAGAITLKHTANNADSISLNGSTGSAIAYTDANGFAVTGVQAQGGNLSLHAQGSGSAITQTGALQGVAALTLNAGGVITLDHSGNQIASLAASQAGTGMRLFDSAGGIAVSGTVRTLAGDMQLRSSGDVTLAASSHLQADTGHVFVSTEGAGNFINQAGSSALVVGSDKRWLVYSASPDLASGAHTVKDGLASSFRRYGAGFSSYAPGAVTESGNGYVYSAAAPVLTVNTAISGPASHVYGDTPTGTLSYTISSGLVDSEDNTANVITGGTAAFDHQPTATLDVASYAFKYTGGLSSAYTLVADPNGAAYTVTPATLTYTAAAAGRAYGAANPALTGSLSGFKLGQTAGVLGGSPAWATPATAASSVGSHAISGRGYSSNNYVFVQAAGNTTALTIGQATLTITARSDGRSYDGKSYSGGAGVDYSGFANNEGASALAGTLSYGGSAQGARNAGDYAITPQGLSADNYSISYGSGTLRVTPAPLSLSVGPVSRSYDGTLAAAGTAFVSGNTRLFGSDSISGGSFAFGDANAGTGKTLTPGGVSINDGNGGRNYVVSYLASTAGEITPAAITLTSANVSKTYDGTRAISGGSVLVTAGRLFANASNGNLTDSLSGGSFSFSDANAGEGNRTVTLSDVSVNDGNAGRNYRVSLADNSSSTIGRAPLVFSGSSADKTYDGTTAAALSGYRLHGLAGSETLQAQATASFAARDAGEAISVNFIGITLSDGAQGGRASNYRIGSAPGTTASILPKTLTASLEAADKVYDGNARATLNGIRLSGLVGNEALIGVSAGSARFGDKNAGTGKTVSTGGIGLLDGGNGGLARNYTVAAEASGLASITPALLQVAGLVALDKVYDGNRDVRMNSQGAVLSGMLADDEVHLSSTTGQFQTKDVGQAKPIVGSSSALSGADAGNYRVLTPAGLSAGVTPRPLNVSATGVNKAHDNSTLARVTLADDRMAGDALDLEADAAFLDPDPGRSKYIAVTGIRLSGGADGGNYSLVDRSTAAFATITGSARPTLAPKPGPEPTPAPAPVNASASTTATPFSGASATSPPASALSLSLPGAVSAESSSSGFATQRSIGVINVDLVRTASTLQDGKITVSVPRPIVESGDGFAVNLPADLVAAVAAKGGRPRITRADNTALPAWIRVDLGAGTFEVDDVPRGALPLTLLVSLDGQTWSIEIMQRDED